MRLVFFNFHINQLNIKRKFTHPQQAHLWPKWDNKTTIAEGAN